MCSSRVSDVDAGVYGVDDRARPEALLDAADERRYSATQVITCQVPGGDPTSAAGTIAGDFIHGVSVAHIFHDYKARRHRTVDECRFQVYDRKGKLLDEVAIKQYRPYWGSDPDIALDLAMFELVRRPRFVERPIELRATKIREGQELMLVAYHFDVLPAYTKRKTRGRVYSTLGTRDERVANMFHTDTDQVPMSSGGLYYDADGQAVGMAQGGNRISYDVTPRRFDPMSDYGRAIRFAPGFLEEFEAFVWGR